MRHTKIIMVIILSALLSPITSFAKKKKVTCTPPSFEERQKIKLNDSLNSELQMARVNLRRKEYVKAISLVDNALKNEDINASNARDAYELKARSLFKLGRIPETKKALEDARDVADSQRVRDEYIGYLRNLNNTGTFIHKKEDDPIVLIRMPPIMPRKAETSGHCDLIFDYDTKARAVKNIRVLSCTNPIFAKPSKKALSKYLLQSLSPSNIIKDTEMTFRYRLVDECGNIIPE